MEPCQEKNMMIFFIKKKKMLEKQTWTTQSAVDVSAFALEIVRLPASVADFLWKFASTCGIHTRALAPNSDSKARTCYRILRSEWALQRKELSANF
jgi:hypothetical protein